MVALKRLCFQYGVLFVLVAALSACSTKVAVNPVEGTTSVKLKNAQKVYIAKANDGRYADNVYSDS
jgi:hypothetical protein